MTMTDEPQLAAARLPIEFRSAGALAVRFPDRIIELVAVPYGQETVVEHRGRLVSEVVDAGAFAGIEKRANRVKVNRDHDITKTVGRVMSLHPERPEGLVAELRIGRSPLGDETLEYAADGILDASIGFAPFPGHEHWSADRRSRRISKAYLGHIALVPEPAYDGANVLAVRGAPQATGQAAASATPILDRILAQRMAVQYSLEP